MNRNWNQDFHSFKFHSIQLYYNILKATREKISKKEQHYRSYFESIITMRGRDIYNNKHVHTFIILSTVFYSWLKRNQTWCCLDHQSENNSYYCCHAKQMEGRRKKIKFFKSFFAQSPSLTLSMQYFWNVHEIFLRTK